MKITGISHRKINFVKELVKIFQKWYQIKALQLISKFHNRLLLAVYNQRIKAKIPLTKNKKIFLVIIKRQT